MLERQGKCRESQGVKPLSHFETRFHPKNIPLIRLENQSELISILRIRFRSFSAASSAPITSDISPSISLAADFTVYRFGKQYLTCSVEKTHTRLVIPTSATAFPGKASASQHSQNTFTGEIVRVRPRRKDGTYL